MRRLTSGPKPSARLRRYIRTSGLSSCARPRSSPAFSQLRSLGGQLGEHLLFVGAMAVMHAVVAGQIARRLARRDDVIGRHAILGVRQRNLFDLGPQRLVNPDRLAHGRFDFGVRARRQNARGPGPAASPASGWPTDLRILRAPADRPTSNRAGRGRRSLPAAAPRLRPCGPGGRSGRGCWRTPPARSG